MNTPAPTFSVRADVTNPGQFFACCGLLELAHRLWPGAEGWFEKENEIFGVCCEDESASLDELVKELRTCKIAGLTEAEKKERDELEKEKRRLQRERKTLPDAEEARRLELGTRAREGAVMLGAPFSLTLNWWQSDDERTPKSWAARQELHRIAVAAQAGLDGRSDVSNLLNWNSVLRPTPEYRKKKTDDQRKVEPFYFDARRFVHALDTGFSLDEQGIETAAHPAVELLTLVGLQRFRPVVSTMRNALDYFAWHAPLGVCVAAAVVCGVVANRNTCRFHSRLRNRDNQGRYKAFSYAVPT